MYKRQSLYNYVDLGLIRVKNIDLPQKLRRKTKKSRCRQHKKVLGSSIEERPTEVNTREKFGHWETCLLYTSLNEAIKRANLTELIPDTFYSRALENIQSWKNEYKDTYDKFLLELSEKKWNIQDFKLALKECRKDALAIFKAVSYTHLIRMILAVGIPNGIENAMFQFGKLAIQSTVSTMGTIAIAAQAMTNIMENLNGIAAIGIGIGPVSYTHLLEPRLLLIDEVSMGLMPIMVNTCFKIIKDLNDSGITVLVVEQNANKALKIANRGYVIETGNIILEDDAKVLRENDVVQKAYLGS